MKNIIRCINDECELNFSCRIYSQKRNVGYIEYKKFIPTVDIELDEIECSKYQKVEKFIVSDEDGGL